MLLAPKGQPKVARGNALGSRVPIYTRGSDYTLGSDYTPREVSTIFTVRTRIEKSSPSDQLAM